jgi:hypothetical protein
VQDYEQEARTVKRTVRTAVIASLVVGALCGIVSVEAQTPPNGQGNSIVIAQNKNTDAGNPAAAANVVASYVNPDGTPADSVGTSIPALASAEFLSTATSLGTPWIGSMVLYSDEELASVADLMYDGGSYLDGKAAAAYTGYGETSDVVYLPRVMVVPGVQVGQISVQNADEEAVTVSISYYFRGQSTPTAVIADTIQPDAAKFYDLGNPGGKVPDLLALDGKAVWEGSAIVEAADEGQIAAVCVTHWAGWAAAYGGVSEPSTHLIGPRVTRRAYEQNGTLKWAEFGAIILQNPNATVATVDVSFYDLVSGALDLLYDDLTIDPNTVLIIHLRLGQHVPASSLAPLDRATGPDIEWNGKVEATSDVPLLGVVIDKRGDGAANEYNMVDVSQGSGVLYMPSVRRVLTGGQGLYSRLAIANLSGDAATFDVYLYDRDGNEDLHLSRGIPGNGVKNLLLWQDMFDDLGENWEGSAYVTSDQSVVSIVDTLWKAGSERVSTYNAIND